MYSVIRFFNFSALVLHCWLLLVAPPTVLSSGAHGSLALLLWFSGAAGVRGWFASLFRRGSLLYSSRARGSVRCWSRGCWSWLGCCWSWLQVVEAGSV
ncbi:hypothetical protein RIF29_10639 [Crotalaria pallida]|uniref:Secreted protein n=1 Tax=Crotalaria pallida TaxID=3830 RepID=A0AAN9IKU5_CROPI